LAHRGEEAIFSPAYTCFLRALAHRRPPLSPGALMLPLYLFALIVGGGLLIFSLLAGHGDAQDSSVELHTDADANLDAHADLHGGDWIALQSILSIRTLLYLLAGFGATGTLIDLLTEASPVVSLLWAVLTGAVAAGLATAIYAWVRGSGSGDLPTEPDYLVGITAKVILPVVQGHRGKIVALHDGREVELLARLYGSEDAVCPRGSEVVIVDVDGETALVTALPQLSSESNLE
jgi:membrane protein implicated in regulation of membrane protease activity